MRRTIISLGGRTRSYTRHSDPSLPTTPLLKTPLHELYRIDPEPYLTWEIEDIRRKFLRTFRPSPSRITKTSSPPAPALVANLSSPPPPALFTSSSYPLSQLPPEYEDGSAALSVIMSGLFLTGKFCSEDDTFETEQPLQESPTSDLPRLSLEAVQQPTPVTTITSPVSTADSTTSSTATVSPVISFASSDPVFRATPPAMTVSSAWELEEDDWSSLDSVFQSAPALGKRKRKKSRLLSSLSRFFR